MTFNDPTSTLVSLVLLFCFFYVPFLVPSVLLWYPSDATSFQPYIKELHTHPCLPSLGRPSSEISGASAGVAVAQVGMDSLRSV